MIVRFIVFKVKGWIWIGFFSTAIQKKILAQVIYLDVIPRNTKRGMGK